MIDSGATHNFMSVRTAERSRLKLQNCNVMRVRLANGVVVFSKQCVSASVSFGQGVVHRDVAFRVVPELNVPVLLGMPWLRTTNPAIDWKLGTVSLGDDSPTLLCADESYDRSEAVRIEVSSLRGCLKTAK